jgi:hypothetical protein
LSCDAIISVVLLGGVIWAVRFLVPRAVKAGDALALASAVLIAVLALLMWLFIGVVIRSGSV